METMFFGTQAVGSLNKEVEWRQWFGGTQGGKFKRSRMETMFFGTQAVGSLNKEVEWRPWFGGTQGGEV